MKTLLKNISISLKDYLLKARFFIVAVFVKYNPFLSKEDKNKKMYDALQILNGLWRPNWGRPDQQKWYPYFTREKDFYIPQELGINNAPKEYICFSTKGMAEYANKISTFKS